MLLLLRRWLGGWMLSQEGERDLPVVDNDSSRGIAVPLCRLKRRPLLIGSGSAMPPLREEGSDLRAGNGVGLLPVGQLLQDRRAPVVVLGGGRGGRKQLRGAPRHSLC